MESGILDAFSVEFSLRDLVCEEPDEMEKVLTDHQRFKFSGPRLVRNSICTDGFSRIAYIHPSLLFILHQTVDAFLPITLHLLLWFFAGGI